MCTGCRKGTLNKSEEGNNDPVLSSSYNLAMQCQRDKNGLITMRSIDHNEVKESQGAYSAICLGV